ncbi:hypothetical protein CYMTET_33007 [Cymbomonas tetramitiformis]|uniref:Uncharacterized protein n=1 Tax=Cymbomonas tetramitiformis TaxID=36881 RepID=A0AAE0FDS0_9CHLO|nr:hypothetical protein CYMTET_33007 [Cymbomonas tetramitiformis]
MTTAPLDSARARRVAYEASRAPVRATPLSHSQDDANRDFCPTTNHKRGSSARRKTIAFGLNDIQLPSPSDSKADKGLQPPLASEQAELSENKLASKVRRKTLGIGPAASTQARQRSFTEVQKSEEKLSATVAALQQQVEEAKQEAQTEIKLARASEVELKDSLEEKSIEVESLKKVSVELQQEGDALRCHLRNAAEQALLRSAVLENAGVDAVSLKPIKAGTKDVVSEMHMRNERAQKVTNMMACLTKRTESARNRLERMQGLESVTQAFFAGEPKGILTDSSNVR